MSAARTESVAIIGGGPGGAECARRLAEHGLAVTVFEARSTHEKPCGGGLPVRALDRYPFLRDLSLPARDLHLCRLIAPSGRDTTIRLHDPVVTVRRADLHRFLLDRAVLAGARLERARVVAFERRTPGQGAGTEWIVRALPAADDDRPAEGPQRICGPFDFLVAADGAAGFARRRLAGVQPSPGLTQGIGCYLEDVSEEAITLAFYRGLRGYLWVFPRPGHSSVGICATLGSLPARDLRAILDRFIEERYGAERLARCSRYAALIPGAGPDPEAERRQGDGWALVGDAGRAVDPLTREGIYYAMRAGTILADCVAAGDPGRYAGAWARECGGEFSWAARHAAGFFEARFVENLVTLADLSPAVGRILSDLIAGRQPYRSLKRRLILNAPRVAWQAAVRLAGAPLRPGAALPQPPSLSRARDSRGSGR